ncbi:MAG TPA: tyrosine-type recombinase/integrase [Mycobacteriales bacterium]|nr:tyrosine-type recombinase/integrase [Mycobacteriales bacterium]
MARRSKGEGTTYQDPASGTYTAEITVDGRRHRRKGFSSQAAATRWLRDLLKTADNNEGKILAPSRVTVGEWLNEWENVIQRRVRLGTMSETTFESYRKNIRLHIRPQLGQLRIQQVNARHLSELYDELLGHGSPGGNGKLSQRTVAYIHAILRACFRDAITRNPPLRQANPCSQINKDDLPRTPARADRGRYNVWEPEQILAFLQHYKAHRLIALYWLYFTRGSRRGELLGVRWPEVDLEHGTIHLIRNRTAHAGRVIERETTKGQGQGRLIPLDSFLVEIMKDHRRRWEAEREAAIAADGWQDTGYVFVHDGVRHPEHKAGGPLHPERLSRSFRRMIVAYNKAHPDSVLPEIRLHDARHSTATSMIFAGIDEQVVAEILGHDSVVITRTIYSHVHKERAARAAAMMTELVLGPPENAAPDTAAASTKPQRRVVGEGGDAAERRERGSPRPARSRRRPAAGRD